MRQVSVDLSISIKSAVMQLPFQQDSPFDVCFHYTEDKLVKNSMFECSKAARCSLTLGQKYPDSLLKVLATFTIQK